MRIALLSLAAAAAIIMPSMTPAAYAQEETIALPPEGHTILNISVTERTEVTQDTLSAALRYEMDGGSANEIQDAINKAVKSALDEAKKYNDVKTSTGGYHVYSYNERNMVDPRTGEPISKKKSWRGSQSITLEGENASALLELAGKIQEMGFLMGGLNYSLSPEKSESVRDGLMTKALGKLGTRASLAAKALNKSGYDILEVNIDSSMPSFPVYRMMAKGAMAMDSAAEMAAPSAEAGESDVTMTINARVMLKP